MQEFVQGGLQSNSTIATALMRFLVKTLAGNAVGGGGGQLKTLTDKVEKLQMAVAMATTVSKDVLKDSKEALTWASTTNTHADNAKNTVNTVYANCQRGWGCWCQDPSDSSIGSWGLWARPIGLSLWLR